MNRRDKRWQIVGDGGLNDCVGCVEVSVREMVTHGGDIDPGDAGLGREQFWVDGFDGFADLDESDPDCVEDQPIFESAAASVVGDRLGRPGCRAVVGRGGGSQCDRLIENAVAYAGFQC